MTHVVKGSSFLLQSITVNSPGSLIPLITPSLHLAHSPVHTRAQVRPVGLHAVPGEHTHALLFADVALARVDVPRVPCR